VNGASVCERDGPEPLSGARFEFSSRPPSEPGVRPITVLIVAGVRLYRDGLAQALSGDARFAVVGSGCDHRDGLTQIAGLQHAPDVGLIDVGPPLGFSTVRALRLALPQMRLLAIAVDDHDDDIVAWAEAGVCGFVTRETGLTDLLTAVASVANDGVLCSPSITARLLRRMESLANARQASAGGGGLTDRETQIVELIALGRSNKQIATELQLSLATVKNHVHAILEKLHVSRRGEAAAAVRAAD